MFHMDFTSLNRYLRGDDVQNLREHKPKSSFSYKTILILANGRYFSGQLNMTENNRESISFSQIYHSAVALKFSVVISYKVCLKCLFLLKRNTFTSK